MKPKHLQQAIRIVGKEPLNEPGLCFDASAFNFLGQGEPPGDDARLCHGIGIANMPGQEGHTMGHAWIEFDDPKRGRVSFDAIWGVWTPAAKYRADLQLTYVVEYTGEQAFALWKEHDYPGPWDPKIRAITDQYSRVSEDAAQKNPNGTSP